MPEFNFSGDRDAAKLFRECGNIEGKYFISKNITYLCWLIAGDITGSGIND